ncbi:MAG: SRPBCC family protein [Myxococcales bacterium]
MSIEFAHSVSNVGDVLPLSIFGIPLLIVRDDEEKIRVFHNIGAHDACPIQFAPGTGQKELVSPYHGWRYDLRGHLTAAPFWDGSKNPAIESMGDRAVGLEEIPSAIWCDTIFVNLSGNAQPFKDYISPVLTLFRGRDVSELEVTSDREGNSFTSTYFSEGNWKTYMENTCINIYHEGFVHQLYRDSPDVPRVNVNGEKTFQEVVDRGLLALYFDLKDASETYPPMDAPSITLPNGDVPTDMAICALFPNTNITLTPQHITIEIARPLGATRTEIREASYLAKGASKRPNYLDLCAGIHRIGEIVAEEDGAMVAGVQSARQSPTHDQVFYSPFWDTLHYEFNNLILNALDSE